MGCVDELATYDVLDDAVGSAGIIVALDGVAGSVKGGGCCCCW